jgi:dATP pyrophosphohydrolase
MLGCLRWPCGFLHYCSIDKGSCILAGHKIPESVLIVVHTADLQVLLLERADHPGFWQSVTGSRDSLTEPLSLTARRELFEETGIRAGEPPAGPLIDWGFDQVYEIYPHWRHRYPEGVTHNTEHVFSICVPAAISVTLAPREHLQYRWLAWDAAAEVCFSWTNSAAIRELAARSHQARQDPGCSDSAH